MAVKNMSSLKNLKLIFSMKFCKYFQELEFFFKQSFYRARIEQAIKSNPKRYVSRMYTTSINRWCLGAFWSWPRTRAGWPIFSDEVETVLQDLDVNKGSGPDASAFAKPLSLLFKKSMATSVFPERWKGSYFTPIFKKDSGSGTLLEFLCEMSHKSCVRNLT
jgi:hypothetical protein